MGFNSGLQANRTAPTNITSTGVKDLPNLINKVVGGIIVGRVTDIILNSNFPNIDKYGGMNSIGTIFFETTGESSTGIGTAKPFYPQISAYPLVNELVLLFKLPNTNIGRNISEESYYYINVVSLWNHPHHNAYPNPLKNNLPPEQQKDYQQTQAGSVRRVTDQSTEINFNSINNPSQDTFTEHLNIHPLLPFAGDIIHQGRWGNSIRFGSTAKPAGSNALNDWSSTGKNGDPITIIRNGQSSLSSNEGWVPITEDINHDSSSIWMSSTQKIPIQVASENYNSYNNAPTTPGQYVGPQILINSDRLIFNAKKDNILLSAEKSVGLSSNDSLNFNTNTFTIDAGSIKLGSKNAKESLILGDTFLKYLESVMKSLNVLCDSLSGLQDWPACPIGPNTPVPNAPINAAAVNLKGLITTFNAQIERYKSTTSKTI
jgi:hypothetical protein